MSRRSTLPVLAILLCGSLITLAADPPAATKPAPTVGPADQPAPRPGKDGKPNPSWLKHHEDLVALAKKGNIDLYFVGDSITDYWQTAGKAVWTKEFAAWNPGDFGISGDKTQDVLWRLQNGELEGVAPKAFVVMIGTNNLGNSTDAQIVAGNTAIVKELQAKNPQAKILLLGIFPRSKEANGPSRQRIKIINSNLAKLDDGKNLKFLDIGPKFLAEDGTLPADVMPDALHPNEKGYQIWADAIKPILTEWLGKQNP